MQMPGLHVDLALRLRHVQVDHARQLGPARRVGDERTLARLDARRHVERCSNVVGSRRMRTSTHCREPTRRATAPDARFAGPRRRRSGGPSICSRWSGYQSLYWHVVDYDLSESGVLPMTIRELLGPDADAEAFLQTDARLPALGRVARGAREHRRLVPGRDRRERHDGQRRLGGQLPDALGAAGARRPAGVHGAELHAGAGGSAVPSAAATDPFG